MGGNIKNKNGAGRPSQEQLAAAAAEKKQQEKQSLIIRTAIAAAVVIAAIAACVFMLSHNFNSRREIFQGTFYGEPRFVYQSESGTDLSGVHVPFIANFNEDGTMVFKYEWRTNVNYYEYDDNAPEPYDGVLTQYTDGKIYRKENIIMGENGDFTAYYTNASVNFTIPQLVSCFGEAATLSMLSEVYSEDVCRLLVAGDYDSINDIQLAEMKVKREQLPELSFALKDLSTVLTMHKLSDEILSRDEALEIWNDLSEVSETDK